LVWVFGIGGGAVLILMLTAVALAWNHKIRRKAGIYGIFGSDRIVTIGDLVVDARLREEAEEVAKQAKQAKESPRVGRLTT
jgi:hypothetical protein